MLYIVLDGLGDRPLEELGGRTPLEAAKTPNLDALVKGSLLGLVHPAGRGIAPESDAGALCLLGYRLPEEGVARGVLEALGAGIRLRPGMLALRANFALVEGERIVDRRAGRDLSPEEGEALAREVEGGVDLSPYRVTVAHTVGHRGVVVIWGPEPLSPDISNLDPAYRREGSMSEAVGEAAQMLEPCRPLSPEGKRSAELVNRFFAQAARVLRGSRINELRRARGRLPINALLLRDAGLMPASFRSLREKFGLSFACVAAMPVEKGIARLLGMELREVPEEQLEAKALEALKLHSSHDVVYVHVKGPDEFGHAGDALGKLRAIEEIDRRFLAPLRARFDGDLLLTSDHSTPCSLRAHSADPVPALLWSSSRAWGDGPAHLSEREAAKGGLGELEGWELLPRALELLGLPAKR